MTIRSPDFAARLRAAGNDLPAVQALYASAIQAQDRSGVVCERDLRYGPHDRHVLDVYRPQTSTAGAPVLVFFHGGGFVRGSKGSRENLGYFLARQGCVAVLANYRLAPESRWPCGPQDVVAVRQWVQREIAGHGGDAALTVLMGESAGAAHVAAAALRSEFHPPDWQIAGAVLLSGPYNARLEARARTQFGVETPDPRNEPYFGNDLSKWDDATTVDHVTAAPFPLLISWTEWDLLQMQVQGGELFARLVSRHGFEPELSVFSQHNHLSQGFSFGTDDTSVSDVVMAFVRRATGG